MTAAAPAVRMERRDGVAWITFERPDRRNAFDLTAVTEFSTALSGAERDLDTRCVVVRGSGDVFSAGADINRLKSTGDPAELGQYIRDNWGPVFRRLREMPKPVIAAVNGAAVGVAASVAMACDLRVANDAASILVTFSKIGLGPDGGASWMLPRLVGRGRALEMFYLAKPLRADEAERLGVFNRVVPAAELEAVCAELAAALVAAPASALAAAKRAVNFGERSTFDEAFENESHLQSICAAQPAFREGLNAFLERRPPDFRSAERG